MYRYLLYSRHLLLYENFDTDQLRSYAQYKTNQIIQVSLLNFSFSDEKEEKLSDSQTSDCRKIDELSLRYLAVLV